MAQKISIMHNFTTLNYIISL